jgi:hypothetical protein
LSDYIARARLKLNPDRFAVAMLEVLKTATVALQVMHEAGVAHGGISASSLRISGDAATGGVDSVRFVDLEHSFSFSSTDKLSSTPLADQTYSELAGNHYKPVDDVMRLLEVVADALTNGRLRSVLDREIGNAVVHEEKLEKALAFKAFSFFLPHPMDEIEICPDISEKRRRRVQRLLHKATSLILEQPVDAVVDYDSVMVSVSAAQRAIMHNNAAFSLM